MKYNQQSHKAYVLERLYEVLDLLGIDRSQAETVTFRQIRQKLNEVYPPLTQSSMAASDQALIRDRKKIFNTARYFIYTLSAIKGRENVN